jgi:hypothetical protein
MQRCVDQGRERALKRDVSGKKTLGVARPRPGGLGAGGERGSVSCSNRAAATGSSACPGDGGAEEREAQERRDERAEAHTSPEASDP